MNFALNSLKMPMEMIEVARYVSISQELKIDAVWVPYELKGEKKNIIQSANPWPNGMKSSHF